MMNRRDFLRAAGLGAALVMTVMQTLRDAGYLTGILGKVGHSTPHADYKWDFVHDQKELGAGRDPELYYSLLQGVSGEVSPRE